MRTYKIGYTSKGNLDAILKQKNMTQKDLGLNFSIFLYI